MRAKPMHLRAVMKVEHCRLPTWSSTSHGQEDGHQHKEERSANDTASVGLNVSTLKVITWLIAISRCHWFFPVGHFVPFFFLSMSHSAT